LKLKSPPQSDAAAAAWKRGLDEASIPWLERAARLAPGDPRITLDLARLRLSGTARDIAAAAGDFERVAQRYDSAAAWLGLAMAKLRLGDARGAAMALDSLLTRHCLPDEPGFAAIAGQIAAAAGYDGFCGLDLNGELRGQGKGRLLGATLDRAALMRVEGLVAVTREGGLSGWACRPAAPDAPPRLTLHDAAGHCRAVKWGKILPADDDAPLLPRHGFKISARALAGLTPPFRLSGPDGTNISGSPLDPAALIAITPRPAARRGRARTRLPARQALSAVIPVYRGLEETKACLESVFAVPGLGRVIVVDDASPEPELAVWLDALAAAGRIVLCRHETNLGFPAAVNTGLAAAAGDDVLLLNSDILLPPGAVKTLRALAYADAATGSVTPFANEASILSYPDPGGGNAMPTLEGAVALDALARRCNGRRSLEIPTGVGFCMYLRHDCLKAVGGLRPGIFAQGYGEENDWCLRARHKGFRHQAALGAYVAHAGGVSFRAAAHGLTLRNLDILERLYPGYHDLVTRFIAADPLRPARARLDAARLQAEPARARVLLISHSHGGGVARQVGADMAALRAQGVRPLLLLTQFPADPLTTPYPWPALLTQGSPKDTPNLAFGLPRARAALVRLLKALGVGKVILHHTLGHHPGVRTLARALGVPQEIVVHDYASFCLRVNLLTRPEPDAPPRYCGEPDVRGCIACCARDHTGIYEVLSVPALLRRSAAEFAGAARVTVPSADAAKRIARHFPGIAPRVVPWEDDALPARPRPPGTGARRIIVIGGIGPAKGFELLVACAEDAAARGLALEFIVAGGSADDERLLATGRIFVTGHYQEGEAQSLIAGLAPDLAFLPSIWPETWCFALGEAWRAGLYAVTFDLGAQAERLRATGRGLTLPLGLPAQRINEVLLNWVPTHGK
jgi:GT2 family glycosyltransferase/glycosyltransferase involved in cell wall biosynthesis